MKFKFSLQLLLISNIADYIRTTEIMKWKKEKEKNKDRVLSLEQLE